MDVRYTNPGVIDKPIAIVSHLGLHVALTWTTAVSASNGGLTAWQCNKLYHWARESFWPAAGNKAEILPPGGPPVLSDGPPVILGLAPVAFAHDASCNRSVPDQRWPHDGHTAPATRP